MRLVGLHLIFDVIIIELIGLGVYSIVYKAEHQVLAVAMLLLAKIQ